ncbi:MAG: hypothetical protein ACOVQX_00430 [Legionella sp.]
MRTQKATAIAKQIHDEGGFYVLALKGNQGALNDDVRLFLESEFKKIDWLSQKSDWAGLKTIAMIEDTCNTKGKVSAERRFFLSN